MTTPERWGPSPTQEIPGLPEGSPKKHLHALHGRHRDLCAGDAHAGNTYPVALLPRQSSQAVEAAVALRGTEGPAEGRHCTQLGRPSSGRGSGSIRAPRVPEPPRVAATGLRSPQIPLSALCSGALFPQTPTKATNTELTFVLGPQALSLDVKRVPVSLTATPLAPGTAGHTRHQRGPLAPRATPGCLLESGRTALPRGRRKARGGGREHASSGLRCLCCWKKSTFCRERFKKALLPSCRSGDSRPKPPPLSSGRAGSTRAHPHQLLGEQASRPPAGAVTHSPPAGNAGERRRARPRTALQSSERKGRPRTGVGAPHQHRGRRGGPAADSVHVHT